MNSLQRISIHLFSLTIPSLAAPSALAYIGPGSGISVIGSLLGLLATVLVAVGAIVLFPVRRMLKLKKRARAESLEVAEQAGSDSSPAERTALEADEVSDAEPK